MEQSPCKHFPTETRALKKRARGRGLPDSPDLWDPSSPTCRLGQLGRAPNHCRKCWDSTGPGQGPDRSCSYKTLTSSLCLQDPPHGGGPPQHHLSENRASEILDSIVLTDWPKVPKHLHQQDYNTFLDQIANFLFCQ